VAFRVEHLDGTRRDGREEAAWQRNTGPNSYWQARLGPFVLGDRVTYTVHGRSPDGGVTAPTASFRVAPKVYLAILWHQHQPAYEDLSDPLGPRRARQPWVRLHAIRDYYSMAALVAEHPRVYLTINLTPSLLRQIEDYAERRVTDPALELTLTPAERLAGDEREELLGTFFEADWHHQIFPFPRYRELFARRQARKRFSAQDLRDLQMWFNLAWFGNEFREGAVTLATGEAASVRGFVEQGRGFSADDIRAMVEEQYKILRAVIPLHRELQGRGQIEVSTTPYDHPILPLLVDTNRATIDRSESAHPARFAHPEDAQAQVQQAVDHYQRWFRRPPQGMWPAEGAVSQVVIPFFARHAIRWIATDQGVLARSGRWGYRVEDPDVLCQPYRAEENGHAVVVFYRDAGLSDKIGFDYQNSTDDEGAARAFMAELKERVVSRLRGDDDRVVTVALDGENPWSAYRENGRPFLHALYRLLEEDQDIQTITFSEYLDGNPSRGIAPHRLESLPKVYDLFTGSWIDEHGSAPGVDLGTWIGEAEENRAWELLGQTRDFLSHHSATPVSAPSAFEAVYAAEGSDWFWWFGDDQDSGSDAEFDDLFRAHLKSVYKAMGIGAPETLDRHIVPRAVIWTFVRPVFSVQASDRLTIQTNCPGIVTWHDDGGAPRQAAMVPAGGVMAGVHRYHLTLGPFDPGTWEVRFRFRCTHPGCSGRDICCRQEEYRVALLP
jgi:alpha-amylase/alpha-mannosidase (GH57 family)